MGTIKIAYVQAVANQVHTRLVPPATNAGSTTSAGSRRMSGQSKVEDSTVAAAPKASAPTTNRLPVVRRSPWLMVVVAMASTPERCTGFVQRPEASYRVADTVKGVARLDVRSS